MGKRLIQQARGKGGPRYRTPSFRFPGKVKYNKSQDKEQKGIVTDIIKSQGHSAPIAKVKFDDGTEGLSIAPEGMKIGNTVVDGKEAPQESGNTLPLENLPEGTLVFNIEGIPGDGGKFCRSSGTFARILSKSGDKITIELPSKRKKSFNKECKASIGIVSGGGRPEKPFLKAGTKHYRMKIKNTVYPIVSGSAMNAVDHPFGNKRTSRKSKARPTSRNAPPGRKVGMIAARRTGRKVHRVKHDE